MRNAATTAALAAAALAGLIAAGCGAQQPQTPGATPTPITVSPAEQCELFQAGADTAGVGLEFVKIKDATLRAGLESALTGVEAAAADYCDAVSAGAAPDALGTALRAYRATLKDFRAKLRAARLQSASIDSWLGKANRLAFAEPAEDIRRL